jgi:hypothetical protein
MQAYGSDRVRQGKGEQWILFCPRPKNWTPRTPKTHTSAEHPGIAILWDDKYFEVVSASPSGTGVRYVLEPWRENHAIRITDVYDEASETARVADHQDVLRRTTHRKTANLLGVLTGHLPAGVQEKLGSELGILPVRLTQLSLILSVAIVAAIAYAASGRILARQPIPPWMLIAGYLGPEAAVRFLIVWTQNRPIGSTIGWLGYSLYYLLSPNKQGMVKPMVVREPPPKLQRDLPVEQIVVESVSVREPLLTLLSPDDQNELAQRYGYNYRRLSRNVALLILFFALAGAVSSFFKLPRVSAFVSLLVAAGIAAEQLLRLSAFSRGPAGSVLGILARPFVRKLL